MREPSGHIVTKRLAADTPRQSAKSFQSGTKPDTVGIAYLGITREGPRAGSSWQVLGRTPMNSPLPASGPAQRNWTRRLANILIALVVIAVAAATFVFSYDGVHAIALL